MKRLKIIIPLLIMIASLLVIPMNAYATEKDFGNYAGGEDFSYDSSWFSCDGCTMCSSKSEMKFWLYWRQ